MPFSNYFSVVNKALQFPLRATVLSLFFSSLYGLLYLASTNAFNSITTSAVLYLVRHPSFAYYNSADSPYVSRISATLFLKPSSYFEVDLFSHAATSTSVQ